MWIRAFFLFLLTTLPASAECVVLLHGLARGPASLTVLENVLTGRGYQVVNADYPSTSRALPELVAYVEEAVTRCPEGPVHVVTHSMGGILLRLWAIEPGNSARIGRAVMLAPPAQGSEIVDTFGDQAWFAWLNGPAGIALGTGPDGIAAELPSVDFPAGVIAGNESLNPVTSALIPGPDDGKVSVTSTLGAGISAHIVLPVTHTWMMNDPRVILEVLSFLETGQFRPAMSWLDAFKELSSHR
ncbi:alpha/beta fold hydrolase [Sinirhodobacter sp. WL0062]|uniref:Alpha/beta fold hydrolase n=1 Tax=Rhodobacter flavimaris TaxID=2907145 RepID=A0ABS8YW30_9RHOB|nr:alpha/beta fold hydrolase [Sinirhodobacter sp. WL0062]MCE5972723.1 alpha/beta fold hydrolase [Sinirhodobacter sp. WL0062]